MVGTGAVTSQKLPRAARQSWAIIARRTNPALMHARRCPGDGVRVWSASVSPAVYYDSLSRGDLSGLGSYDFNPVLVVDLQMAGNQIPYYSTLGEHYLL
jgi:hypothetical protein